MCLLRRYSLIPNKFWDHLLKFNPLLRLPEFCSGIVLGRVLHELRTRNSLLVGRGYLLYLPGTVLWALSLRYFNVLPYPLVHNGLLLPFYCLVICGLALDGGIVAQLLSVRPLIFLGNASFAMYVLHQPIAETDATAMTLFSTKIHGILGFAFYVFIVVCASALVFQFVEEPANRILKKRLLGLYDSLSNKLAIRSVR